MQYFCTKKGCGCGEPVYFLTIEGRRVAFHERDRN